MTEEKPRVQKVLAYLYDAEEQVRPKEVADAIGETPLNVGKDLHDLKARGLAVAEVPGQWTITPEGRERIESGEPKETERKEREKEIAETIPSQSDLFRSIGEKLGVGSKRGDIRLDAVTYYVQRTANLDNLTSVWNAMTEMGIAADVRKRWVKLYAMNLPGKEIPEELREKLEGGEPERIKTEAEGVSAKPKRFSVISGEIVGDPEGDYNFKEALQLLAQQRGAPAEAVNSLATMVEAMKMGPEMATSTLTAMIPLITKEPPKQGGEGELLSKLDSLGLLRKSGEGEGSETMRALQTEVKELRDAMQKQEMDTMKNAIISVSNQMSEMRKEMANQNRLEGRYAILDKTITTIDGQLSGFRSDARPLLDSMARGGGRVEPKIRSPEEKAKIAKGLKVAVAQERRARQLEDKLLFGVSRTPPEVTAEPTPAPEPAPPPITYME